MKRIVIIAIILVILASIFVITLSSNHQPHAGNIEVSLCKANVYSEASLTDAEVLTSLHKGDTFTLTGNHKTVSNGKGAKYSLWEGTVSDGTIGWVKANAFIETDKYGY